MRESDLIYKHFDREDTATQPPSFDTAERPGWASGRRRALAAAAVILCVSGLSISPVRNAWLGGGSEESDSADVSRQETSSLQANVHVESLLPTSAAFRGPDDAEHCVIPDEAPSILFALALDPDAGSLDYDATIFAEGRQVLARLTGLVATKDGTVNLSVGRHLLSPGRHLIELSIEQEVVSSYKCDVVLKKREP